MNRRLLHIVLLLAATVSFVAHAVVTHHHHIEKVCIGAMTECRCCAEHGGCDCQGGCGACHDADMCEQECVAFALFDLPHSGDDRSVVVYELPDWLSEGLLPEETGVPAVCRGHVSVGDGICLITECPTGRSSSLRAPPVGLCV